MATLGMTSTLQINITTNLGTIAYGLVVIIIPLQPGILGFAQSQTIGYMSTNSLLGKDSMTQIVILTTNKVQFFKLFFTIEPNVDESSKTQVPHYYTNPQDYSVYLANNDCRPGRESLYSFVNLYDITLKLVTNYIEISHRKQPMF